MTVTARVFNSGTSQVIRIPREFQVDTREVYIHREAKKLIIEPKPFGGLRRRAITWGEFLALPPLEAKDQPDPVPRDHSFPEDKGLFADWEPDEARPEYV